MLHCLNKMSMDAEAATSDHDADGLAAIDFSRWIAAQPQKCFLEHLQMANALRVLGKCGARRRGERGAPGGAGGSHPSALRVMGELGWKGAPGRSLSRTAPDCGAQRDRHQRRYRRRCDRGAGAVATRAQVTLPRTLPSSPSWADRPELSVHKL